MTRTIEQILGLTPMNQNDLVASPMTTLFVDNPPADHFLPWTHVPNGVPLTYGVAGYVAPANVSVTTSGSPAAMGPQSAGSAATALQSAGSAVQAPRNAGSAVAALQYASPAVRALQAGWLKKKAEIFAGKYHMPDAEDADIVSHYDWYEATAFKVPFPGEKTVRPASDFNNAGLTPVDDDD